MHLSAVKDTRNNLHIKCRLKHFLEHLSIVKPNQSYHNYQFRKKENNSKEQRELRVMMTKLPKLLAKTTGIETMQLRKTM